MKFLFKIAVLFFMVSRVFAADISVKLFPEYSGGAAYEKDLYHFFVSKKAKDKDRYCGKHAYGKVRVLASHKKGVVKIVPCSFDAFLTLKQIKAMDEFLADDYDEDEAVVKIIAKSLIYRLKLYQAFENEGYFGIENAINDADLYFRKYFALFLTYLRDSSSKYAFVRNIHLSKNELIEIFEFSYQNPQEINMRYLVKDLTMSFLDFFIEIGKYKRDL